MPVVKGQRSEQISQTPFGFSMVAQTETRLFFCRNVIVLIHVHPHGKMDGMGRFPLVMVQITVKVS